MFPEVQSKIGQYATKELNKKYKTNINVEQVVITAFGGVKLKKVLILDHHKDTLIFANRIKTSILDFDKLMNTDLIFGEIIAHGLYFKMKIYKNEKLSNLDVFVNAFGKDSPPSKKHFFMTATKVKVTDGHYKLINENYLNPKEIDFNSINLSATALRIYGSEVSATLNKVSFDDHRGLSVKDLSTKFSYTKKQIKLDNLKLITKESRIEGKLVMNYKIEDFAHFTDKVEFDVILEDSSLATNDIRYFYDELGKNIFFKIDGRMKGTLNNLVLSDFHLIDSKKSEISGDINFKNLFPSKGKEFYMDGKFKKLSTSYNDLVTVLPNILGKQLPVSLKKLGVFNLVGQAQVTTHSINARLVMNSLLGNVKSVFKIDNMTQINQAVYKGNIDLTNFDIGSLVDRNDLKKVNLIVDINGKGFTEKSLNTSLKGKIKSFFYNNYTYNNIDIEGNFVKGLYEGQVKVNDPNLKLDFDGLIDLNKVKKRYDFQINIAHADLKKINFTKNKVSNFKGNIKMNLTGNSIDNIEGEVFVKQATFQNPKSTYFIEDFYAKSEFDQNKVRTITFNSPDIINGEVKGKFYFNQLQKLVTNSLGSLYHNYKPIKVNRGQFLDFNLLIHNKIIEILYPQISIASNTIVKGSINSDNKEFKLNFDSPQIKAFDNSFENIRLKVDNKNPLYNAFIELDSIKTKYYKIRDFSLINIRSNDTLLFRSEFKGGSKGSDYFNLNFFHTIDEDNKHVVGLNKSDFKIKDYVWYVNENNIKNNRIVIDKTFENFHFDDILLTHEDQDINFSGDIKGNDYKDLQLNFKGVDLNQITPYNPNFTINGELNANVHLKQIKNIYEIPATIRVNNLNVNKTSLGDLSLDIVGDENFKKFTVSSTIENNSKESFGVGGSFEIVENNTLLDLELKLNQFNLGIFEPLGGEVISKIRGFASGGVSVTGDFKKPEINGRIYLDDSGLKIPYLNVEYALDQRTIVDLTNKKFLFKKNVLTDTKHSTTGYLNGVIEHNNFSDWKLDLSINSKRFLVLDTKDSEEAAYFGTAFIDGKARITGPTNGLFIKVDAQSEKGSSLKIPINNSESVSENEFIHFITAKEKYNLKKGITDNSRNYKGLELEFNLDITPNAEVEVILDRNTGHGMKGKGNGTLLLQINTLGKFNMWGDFQAYEGFYNFKYGGLIDKKFMVKKGGYISWEGNPLKARLNLEAIYNTSANPALLLENSAYNKKIDVNVVIGIRGDLTNPEPPEFNFEFPTVSNVMKSQIDYKLGDKDIRQTQALYLLSTGSFLSTEGLSQSALSQSAYETASNLLSSLINSNDERFKVNLGIIGSDNTLGREVDGRFVASISSKINDRITINGKVGVPFGGISQTAVVGDIEMLYRVNEDGTVNLRFFNRENDITYIGEGIGYTQGVGISYQVDFNTFNELVNKIFKTKKNIKIIKSDLIDEDLIPIDDKKAPSKPNVPQKKDENPNSEGIVPEEE